MATNTKTASRTTKKKVTKKGSTAAKKKTAPSTVFSLYAPNVNEVYLAGDFNDWQPDAKDYQLRKFKGDIWKKSLNLRPGRYEYQFVVDGQWWCDPENVNRVTNAYCTENCVLEIK